MKFPRPTGSGFKTSTYLRIITHTGSLLPLLVMGAEYSSHNLTANPIQAATQRTGDTALVLLLFSLVCTPLFTLFRFAPAIKVRRTLGLYAFAYALIHVYLFVGVDYGFNWVDLSFDALPKLYIWIGAAAFLILLALATTAFPWFQRRMGKNWKRLHRLVYLAAALVVAHFFWVAKGDIFRMAGNIRQPLAYGLILVLLLALRLPPLRRRYAGWYQNIRYGRQIKAARKAAAAKESAVKEAAGERSADLGG